MKHFKDEDYVEYDSQGRMIITTPDLEVLPVAASAVVVIVVMFLMMNFILWAYLA